MDNDGSTVESVRAWLERGGYVLEMQVARLLAGQNLSIEQGYRYTDPVTGKEREGDLTGFMDFDTIDDHWHALDLVIECKSTTAPWVGFIGHTGGNGPFTAGSYLDADCDLCMAMLLRFAELRRESPNVYALTEKRSGNGKDYAYEAVQQAASAVLGRYSSAGFDGHADTKIVTMLAVPIVVTESPLFTCALDGDGNVILEPVARMTVVVPRLRLPEPDSDGVEILVVRSDALLTLVADLAEMAGDLRLENEP